MSDPIVLTLPDDLSERVREIAQSASLSIEQIVIDHLRTIAPPQMLLAPDEQGELDALRHLTDDTLWTIAREQMPDELQSRAHRLMDKNTFGTITREEYLELETLVDRGNRLNLRKAEAALILRERGHRFTQQDYKPSHE